VRDERANCFARVRNRTAEYVPSALRDSEPRPERSDGAAEFLPQLPVFAAAGGGGLAKNSEPKS